MERFQIRLHGRSLEDVVAELADQAWQALDPSATGAGAKGTESMRSAVAAYLGERLRRYDTCGSVIFCGECVLLRPLVSSREEGDPRTDPNLREDAEIYQLFAEPDLVAFIDGLTTAASAGLAGTGAVGEANLGLEARRKLRASIRGALAPFVYYNAECGQHRECQSAVILPKTK